MHPSDLFATLQLELEENLRKIFECQSALFRTLYTAISSKVVEKSARDNPERYYGSF